MRDLTQEQAVAIFESKVWERWTDHQRVEFQLFTERLCMPFDVFHAATEKVLGRGVFTHEFAFPEHLRAEFLKERQAPTFEQIIELIPADKRPVLAVTP